MTEPFEGHPPPNCPDQWGRAEARGRERRGRCGDRVRSSESRPGHRGAVGAWRCPGGGPNRFPGGWHGAGDRIHANPTECRRSGPSLSQAEQVGGGSGAQAWMRWAKVATGVQVEMLG